MRLAGLIAIFALITLQARAADAPACTLDRLTSLDLSPLGPLNSVQAQLNGRNMFLVVDTGGAISMLKASSAAQLGLPVRRSTSVKLLDVYGNKIDQYIVVDELGLGPLKGKKISFMIMPNAMASPFMDGLLGPDLLSGFDVEFDFAKKQLNLYSPKHCPGQVVYWTTDPYAAIPLRLDQAHHILTHLELDGHKVETYIDTGASESFIPINVARRLFNWKTDPPELQVRTARINNTETRLYSYPFKTLSLEGVTVFNPQIKIGEEILKGQSRLVLGMNILKQLHIYIAYKEQKLYATARDATLPAGMSFAPNMGFTTPETPQWPEPSKPWAR